MGWRKRYHRLTDTEEDKVMALLAQGVPRKYIAERFDVSLGAIYRVIVGKEANDAR